MISVLLADDHAIVRSGLKQIINHQPDMQVLYEAGNGEEAVSIALAKQPDVVIMDLHMPEKNGLIATKQISEANPAIKIIILTMHKDKEYLFRVLEAGASSYMLKSEHENDLIEAIRGVHRGETYFNQIATKYILEDYLKKTEENTPQKLSGREQEILSYLAQGYKNREIAEKLFLSIKTIEAHRLNIMEKLNLKTRPDLVKFAFKNGYLEYP